VAIGQIEKLVFIRNLAGLRNREAEKQITLAILTWPGLGKARLVGTTSGVGSRLQRLENGIGS
jgi:hypothetical protein